MDKPMMSLGEFKDKVVEAQRCHDEYEVDRLLKSYRSCDLGAIHVDHFTQAMQNVVRQEAIFFAERLSPTYPHRSGNLSE